MLFPPPPSKSPTPAARLAGVSMVSPEPIAKSYRDKHMLNGRLSPVPQFKSPAMASLHCADALDFILDSARTGDTIVADALQRDVRPLQMFSSSSAAVESNIRSASGTVSPAQSRPVSRSSVSVLTSQLSAVADMRMKQIVNGSVTDEEIRDTALAGWLEKQTPTKRPSTTETVRRLTSSSMARRKALDKIIASPLVFAPLENNTQQNRRMRVADLHDASSSSVSPTAQFDDVEDKLNQSVAIMEFISENKAFKRPQTSLGTTSAVIKRTQTVPKPKVEDIEHEDEPMTRGHRNVSSVKQSQRHVDYRLEELRVNEMSRHALGESVTKFKKDKRMYVQVSAGRDFVECNRAKYTNVNRDVVDLDRRKFVERFHEQLDRVAHNQEILYWQRQEWASRIRRKHDNAFLLKKRLEKEHAERIMVERVRRVTQQMEFLSLVMVCSRASLLVDKLVLGRVGRKMENAAVRCARRMIDWWMKKKEEKRKELKMWAIVRLRLHALPYVRVWKDSIRSRAVRHIVCCLRIIRDTHGILLYMKRYRFRAVMIQRWWREQLSREQIRVGILRIQWEQVEEKRLRVLLKRVTQGKKCVLYIDLIKKHPGEPTFSALLVQQAQQSAADIPFSRRTRPRLSMDNGNYSNSSQDPIFLTSLPDPQPVESRVPKKKVQSSSGPSFLSSPDYEELELSKVPDHIRDHLLQQHLRIRIRAYRTVILKMYHAEQMIAAEKKNRDMLEEVRKLIALDDCTKRNPLWRTQAPEAVWGNAELRREWYYANRSKMLESVPDTSRRAYRRIAELLEKEALFDMTLVFPDEFRQEGYRLPKPSFQLLLDEDTMTSLVEVGEIRARREKMFRTSKSC
eukprot:ANDGO_07055.mRNA.1 hypothetical protein